MLKKRSIASSAIKIKSFYTSLTNSVFYGSKNRFSILPSLLYARFWKTFLWNHLICQSWLFLILLLFLVKTKTAFAHSANPCNSKSEIPIRIANLIIYRAGKPPGSGEPSLTDQDSIPYPQETITISTHHGSKKNKVPNKLTQALSLSEKEA